MTLKLNRVRAVVKIHVRDNNIIKLSAAVRELSRSQRKKNKQKVWYTAQTVNINTIICILWQSLSSPRQVY